MVALPPSPLSRSASIASKKATKKWPVSKWIQSLLIAVWTISSVMGGLVYSAPKAHAAETSFDTLFEDCSDDASEATWSGIKACLQGVTMDAKYQPVWSGVIRPKLVQFFDNHAVSGGGIDDTILHKSFMFDDTFPSTSSLDSQINLMLTEAGDGKDRFEEIGDVFDKALEGDRTAVLCQLYDVPPVMLYGEEGVTSPDYDDSGPLTCDSSGAASSNFLVKGLSAATVYMIADIISTDNFAVTSEENPRLSGLISDVKSMMGQMKTYIGNDDNLVTPRRANPRSPHKNLRAFYSANLNTTSVLASDGPIETLMSYCQSEGLRGVNLGRTTADYINAVKDCYTRALTDTARTMTDRSKEFVRNILVPATAAYATKVAAFTDAGDQAKAREFMQSLDYVQLGEAYDPLAGRRSEYPMADYLSETINDSYTDSVSWVNMEYQADDVTPKVSLSGNAPVSYYGDFTKSVRQVIAWHAFYINEALTSEQNYTIFLDRPLAAAPATTPAPAASPASSGGDVAAQNRQLFLNEIKAVRRVQVQSNRNVLQQMNDYIQRSANASKPIMMFVWFWLATESHDPNYSGAPEHFTGDLSLISESIPADGAVAQFFSDPYLARITNACSPNTFSDTVQKADLEPWQKCLEHEKEFVDKSDSSRVFKMHNTGTETNFTLTMPNDFELLKMRRSQPVVEAMESMIATIQSCRDRAACLSLNDRDVGDQGTRQSGNTPGSNDPGDSMLSAILSILNLILGLIIKFLLWLTALVMSFFQSVLSYAGFTTSDFVVKMWKAVRDFVNLFFILALLGIAVANIVQYEINNYAVKTILPKLIVVVIVVNFSRLIVGLGIDAGNVMEAGIYQIAGMGPHGGGTQAVCSTTTTQVGTLDVSIPQDIKDGSILCRLAKGLRFQELQNYRETGNANQSTLTSLFLINIAILLILVMMLFGFLALAITFTIRIIVLWALAITSPLFVISKISPMGSSISGEWQSKFVKYAFMQVKVAFFLTLAVLASEAVGSQIFSSVANTSPAVGGGSLSPVGFNSLADYLQLIFVIAMIYAAAFTAAKGDYGNGFIDSIASNWKTPWKPVVNGVKTAGRVVGAPVGAMGYIGNRLQDTKGNGLFAKGTRALGYVIASPSNYTNGAKAVLGDLKQSASERKERFGTEVASTLSRPFGQDMRDRFQAKVASNEMKIINEITNDAKMRFNPDTILRKAQDALRRNDLRSFRGLITAYAQSGGDLAQFGSADGKRLRDQIIEAETRRNTTGGKEERLNNAQKVLRDLENMTTQESGNRFSAGKSFAGRTDDKNQIKRELDEALERGDKSYALGIITAGFEGRLKGAGADAMATWMRMERGNDENKGGDKKVNVQITENDRRLISKATAKDSVAVGGIMLGRPVEEGKFYDQVFSAAKEMGLLNTSANNFSEVDKSMREEVDRVVASLAALGKVEQNGVTRYLSEVKQGIKALETIAATQINAFGEIKPSGDDGNIGTILQGMNAKAMALASSMTESGKFRGDTKMIREAMLGYVKNAALIGDINSSNANQREAAQFNLNNLNEYLASLGGSITTEAQVNLVKNQIDILIGGLKSRVSEFDNDQTKVDRVQRALGDFKARIEAEARKKPLASGRGEDDTSQPPAPTT